MSRLEGGQRLTKVGIDAVTLWMCREGLSNVVLHRCEFAGEHHDVDQRRPQIVADDIGVALQFIVGLSQVRFGVPLLRSIGMHVDPLADGALLVEGRNRADRVVAEGDIMRAQAVFRRKGALVARSAS